MKNMGVKKMNWKDIAIITMFLGIIIVSIIVAI